jgi:hypothetical protein
MSKILAGLKDRILGSPVSTLGGALTGAITLGLHTALGTVNWADVRQTIIAAASAGIPVVIGALFKAAPKLDPQASAITQKIADAVSVAAQRTAATATDKVIAEILKLGGEPSVIPNKEGTTA